MANPLVTITLPSGTTKTIMTRSVNVGFNKNNGVNPNANIAAGLAQVQTQSVNNPAYQVIATFDPAFSAASYLQYTDLIDLANHQYTGSNQVKLYIYYGKRPNAVILPSFTKSTSGIPVVFDSVTMPIDISDSTDGYQQTVSLSFIETA
jgi:hypothetical protein